MKPYKVGITCQTLFFQVMHRLACYKAIPHNTTNCSLSNYPCIDVDGDVLNSRMVVTQNSGPIDGATDKTNFRR